MPKDQVIVALDIGSTKFSSVVATSDGAKISVIGTYTHPSSGIKDGVVNNIDKAVNAISETLSKAEMMSGHPISRVAVTVSGTHIESLNSHGVVAVAGGESEISAEDVIRVNEAAQAISLPSSRQIIHVIPREYVVDKQKGIFDPIGMTGVRLEVEANIIHGSASSIKNLTKCVHQVGVETEQLIYTGLASGEAVLTDTEKELGTLLVDIGGGTMELVVYTDGRPAFAAVLPIGGQQITNDIAVGLRTSLENAEKVKIKMSTEEKDIVSDVYLSKEGKEAKVPKGEIYVGDMNIGMETVPKNMLNEIVRRRLEEAFKFVQIYMKRAGFDKKLPAGVVLTGGGAQTKNITKVAEDIFRQSVRVGYPSGISGLVDQIQGPAYAATVGALKLVSVSLEEGARNAPRKSGSIKGVIGKTIKLFKSFMP